MRTKRIELEGSHGHVTIDREKAGTIWIDSFLRDPASAKGEKARLTWEVPARISDEDLFKIAEAVQRRCDGTVGTNSMVHDYYREMQRFQD